MQNIVTQLAQQFGLKGEQVQAAAGAVLQLLQEKSGNAEFQALVAKVPGAQAWIEQAKALPSQAGQVGGGLLGQASSLLGAVTGQAQSGIAGIIGKLESAGFKPDSAMQFVPALLEQLKGAAGPDTLNKVIEQVPGLNQGTTGALLGKFLK